MTEWANKHSHATVPLSYFSLLGLRFQRKRFYIYMCFLRNDIKYKCLTEKDAFHTIEFAENVI
jgi:hypothetical protein